MIVGIVLSPWPLWLAPVPSTAPGIDWTPCMNASFWLCLHCCYSSCAEHLSGSTHFSFSSWSLALDEQFGIHTSLSRSHWSRCTLRAQNISFIALFWPFSYFTVLPVLIYVQLSSTLFCHGVSRDSPYLFIIYIPHRIERSQHLISWSTGVSKIGI